MAKKSKKGTYPLSFPADVKGRNASFEAWYGDYNDWLVKSPKGTDAPRGQSRLQMKAKAKFDLAPEGKKKMDSMDKEMREGR